MKIIKIILMLFFIIGLLIAGSDSETLSFKYQFVWNVFGTVLFCVSGYFLTLIYNKENKNE